MIGNSVLADTNIIIDLMKGDSGIAQKLESFDEVCLSPVILAELYFGVFRSSNPQKHLGKVAMAILNTKLLAIDGETSELFVRVKLALAAKGKPIPENDMDSSNSFTI